MQFHSISKIGPSHMSNSIGTAIARIFHPTSRAVEKIMKSEGGAQAFIKNLRSLENGVPKQAFRDRLQCQTLDARAGKLETSLSRDLIKSALKEVREIKHEAKASQRGVAEGLPGSSNHQAYKSLQATRELATRILHAPHKPQ